MPSSQREENVYYFGFFSMFSLVIIYAGPVYLLVGLPLSIYIDKLIEVSKTKTKWAKYFIGLGLYSLVGMLVMIAFLFIINQFSFRIEFMSFSIYGIVASNIYYHLSLLLLKIYKKQRGGFLNT